MDYNVFAPRACRQRSHQLQRTLPAMLMMKCLVSWLVVRSAAAESETPTPSRTWSRSRSCVPSVMTSPTDPTTPSASTTASILATQFTPSATRSCIPSGSRRSPSAMSVSASASSTPTTSMTMTQASTNSPSVSASTTSSPTTTISSSSTPSVSRSSTASRSISVSPSISSTPLPASLRLSTPLQSNSTGTGTIAVSAALPPVKLAAMAANVHFQRAVIACSAPGDDHLDVFPPRTTFDPGASRPVEFTVLAKTGGRRTDAGRRVGIECVVTDPGENTLLARARMMLAFAPTLWPMYDEVVVVFESGQAVAASGWRANASLALVEACALMQGNCNSVPLALNISEAVLVAVSDVLRARPSRTVDVAFAQTLSTGTTMVLVSQPCLNGTREGSFSNATIVTVGGVRCPSVAASDGCMLALRTPPATALGCTHDSNCGYKPLVVSNPGSGDVLGGTLSCPPFCAGANVGAVPFVRASNEPPIPAFISEAAAPVLAPLMSSSMGLFYTAQCTDPAFTDVASGACTNESDSLSMNCAYGFGDACSRCPAGALCPGGARLWPRVGFYTASETSGQLVPCAPPAERCTGWDRVGSVTTCASGYLTGSFGCLACAPSFYPGGDGTCTPCPIAKGLWERVSSFAFAVGGVLGALLVMQGFVVVVTKMVGGSVTAGAQRVLQLVIWTMGVLQLSAQTSRSMPPGLPPIVARWNEALTNLQFEGITVPVGCDTGDPFGGPFIQMVVAVTLTALAVTFWTWAVWRTRIEADGTRGGGPAWLGPVLRQRVAVSWRVVATVLVLMYPLITNTTLQMLVCKPVNLPASVYTSLSGDGATLTRAGLPLPLTPEHYDTIISVQLLASNPSQVCYEAQHFRVGVLACVTLVVYVLALPAVSCWWTRNALLNVMRSRHGDAWTAACAEDVAARKAMVHDGVCMRGCCKRAWLLCAGARCMGPSHCGKCARSVSQAEPNKPASIKPDASIRAPTDSLHSTGHNDTSELCHNPLMAKQRKAANVTTNSTPAESEISQGNDANSSGVRVHVKSEHDGAKAPTPNKGLPEAKSDDDAARPGCACDHALDHATEPSEDWLLRPLVSNGFRTSAYPFFVLERYTLLGLAGITAWFGRASHGLDAVLQPALTCGVVFWVAWLYATRDPFEPSERWKVRVRVVSLISMALSTITNTAGLAAATEPSNGVASAVAPLAWVSAFMSVTVLVVLVWGFFASVVTGARREERAIRAARAAAAAKSGVTIRAPVTLSVPQVDSSMSSAHHRGHMATLVHHDPRFRAQAKHADRSALLPGRVYSSMAPVRHRAVLRADDTGPTLNAPGAPDHDNPVACRGNAALARTAVALRVVHMGHADVARDRHERNELRRPSAVRRPSASKSNTRR